jgi:glycerol-3-phosphate dehydrogenase
MKRFIDNYKGKEFDVIIIGGGITGATVAYEAASRGLSVALIEKSDFGNATSSATSKMIHGGLRYLSTFEFGLVRESLRERRVLTNIAPNFVHPSPFLFATYKDDKTSHNKMKTGMLLYELLSFDKNRLKD